MRGDPRVPETFEDVELGRRALEAEHAGGEADLVLVGRVRQTHRLLVERREAHRIRLAIGRHAQRVAVVGQRRGAARLACDASLNRGWIEVVQVYEFHGGSDAGDPRAFVKYAPIANDNDARGFADLFERNDLRGELGADATRISHRQGDYGASARRGIHVVISGK